MLHQLAVVFLSMLFLSSCTGKDSTPESCMENPGNGKLFVFVGEKVDIKDIPGKGGMDAKFLARYKILQKVCGSYKGDTIEFTVYDHYGTTAFEKYKNVMLFLSEHEGKFYHEKYQYFDLYKADNGRWASPSVWMESSDSTIRPQKINFVPEVSFDISGFKRQRVKEEFPYPFYKIENGKAIAQYGNYVPELLELKKKGVLRARGLFGEAKSIEFTDTQLAEMAKSEAIKISNPEYQKVANAWKSFLHAIESQNTEKIKGLSFDSVICAVCEGFTDTYFYNDLEPIDSFITASYRNFPSSEQWEKISSKKIIVSAIKYFDQKNSYSHLNLPNYFIVYKISFQENVKKGPSQWHEFSFIKTGNDIKFYGMETY